MFWIYQVIYFIKINFICFLLIKIIIKFKIIYMAHILFLLDRTNLEQIRKSVQNIGHCLCHSIVQRLTTET